MSMLLPYAKYNIHVLHLRSRSGLSRVDSGWEAYLAAGVPCPTSRERGGSYGVPTAAQRPAAKRGHAERLGAERLGAQRRLD